MVSRYSSQLRRKAALNADMLVHGVWPRLVSVVESLRAPGSKKVELEAMRLRIAHHFPDGKR